MRQAPILIVGAGIAGLTAARELTGAGRSVVVVDKGRGVGGRCATRRIGDHVFDHGAQFFTARDQRFARYAERWLERGAAVPWCDGMESFVAGPCADGRPRYRGAPAMTAIAKDLADGLDIRLETLVSHAARRAESWAIHLESGETLVGCALLLTAPMPQSVQLVRHVMDLPLDELDAIARSLRYRPAFALMACLDGPAALPAAGAIRDLPEPLSWIAEGRAKGISPRGYGVTIHAGYDYTEAHFDAAQRMVADDLLAAAAPWLGEASVTEWQLHRWRYALPEAPRPEPIVIPGPAPLIFAGDAFGGAKIEGAALSGIEAAARLDALLPR